MNKVKNCSTWNIFYLNGLGRVCLKVAPVNEKHMLGSIFKKSLKKLLTGKVDCYRLLELLRGNPERFIDIVKRFLRFNKMYVIKIC